MVTFSRAHRELFRRAPDESFPTLKELYDHCRRQREDSTDVRQLPRALQPLVLDGGLRVRVTTASA